MGEFCDTICKVLSALKLVSEMSEQIFCILEARGELVEQLTRVTVIYF